MSTKQLIALWYGGLAVSGVLFFQASEDSSTGPLLLAIVLLAGLAIYTFRPHTRADKRQALSFVLGPVMFLAIGMVAAAAVSEARCGFQGAARQRDLLESLGLPVVSPKVDPDEVRRLITFDKKRDASERRKHRREERGQPVALHQKDVYVF